MDLLHLSNHPAIRCFCAGVFISWILSFVGTSHSLAIPKQDGGNLSGAFFSRTNSSLTIFNITLRRDELPFNINITENATHPFPSFLLPRGTESSNPEVTTMGKESTTDDVESRNITVCIGGYGYPQSCPRPEDPAGYTRCCRAYDEPSCCEERAEKVCGSKRRGADRISGWNINVNTTYNVIFCPQPDQDDEHTSCAFTNEDIGCFSRVTSKIIIWCLIGFIAFVFPIAFTLFVLISLHREKKLSKKYLTTRSHPIIEVVIHNMSKQTGADNIPKEKKKKKKKKKKYTRAELLRREEIRERLREQLFPEEKLADDDVKDEVAVKNGQEKLLKNDSDRAPLKSNLKSQDGATRRKKSQKDGRERKKRSRPRGERKPYYDTSGEIRKVSRARDKEKDDAADEAAKLKEVVIVHEVPDENHTKTRDENSSGISQDDSLAQNSVPPGAEGPSSHLYDGQKDEVECSDKPLNNNFDRFDQGYNSMKEKKEKNNTNSDNTSQPKKEMLQVPDLYGIKREPLLNGHGLSDNDTDDGAQGAQDGNEGGGASLVQSNRPRTQKLKQRAFSRSDTGYDSMKEGNGDLEKKKLQEELERKGLTKPEASEDAPALNNSPNNTVVRKTSV